MKHYAISSFVPVASYWCFHWPAKGPAKRDQVVEGMPDPLLFKVLSLPCQHAAHVHWQGHARWVVLEIDEADFVENDGFVDFQSGIVLFNGPPHEAYDFLKDHGLPVPRPFEVEIGNGWDNASVGNHGLAVAGVDGVAQAGDHGVAYGVSGSALAGDGGIAISQFAEVRAGNRGIALAMYGASATAGDHGLASTDEFGTASAGRGGVAITATGGKAVVGEMGLALARHGGAMLISGVNGMSFALAEQEDGKVQAGEGGILLARWHDGTRYRIAIAYVGENSIKPDTPYQLDMHGRFVECIAGPD